MNEVVHSLDEMSDSLGGHRVAGTIGRGRGSLCAYRMATHIGSGEAADIGASRRPSHLNGPFGTYPCPSRLGHTWIGSRPQSMRAVFAFGRARLLRPGSTPRVGDRGVGQHVDQRRPSRSQRSLERAGQLTRGADQLAVAPERSRRSGRNASRAAARRRPSSRRETPSGASRAPDAVVADHADDGHAVARQRVELHARRNRTPRRPAAARPGARGGPASPPARSPARTRGTRTVPGQASSRARRSRSAVRRTRRSRRRRRSTIASRSSSGASSA